MREWFLRPAKFRLYFHQRALMILILGEHNFFLLEKMRANFVVLVELSFLISRPFFGYSALNGISEGSIRLKEWVIEKHCSLVSHLRPKHQRASTPVVCDVIHVKVYDSVILHLGYYKVNIRLAKVYRNTFTVSQSVCARTRATHFFSFG